MSIVSALSQFNRKCTDIMSGSTIVLYYHRVLPHRPSDDPEKLVITCDEFEAHLSMIAHSFQTPRLIDEVRKLREGKRLTSHAVCLTFDDGYRDNFTYALPLLEKYKIPATFFVTTRHLKGEGSFYWDKLSLDNDYARKRDLAQTLTPTAREEFMRCEKNERIAERLFATPELLAQASRNPFVEIGGHTHSHAFLPSLSTEEAREEIIHNRNLLQEITDTSPRLFAYPYGTKESFGLRDEQFVKDCGYEAAFSTTHAQMRKGRDLFALPRIGASELSPQELRTLISSFLGCS